MATTASVQNRKLNGVEFQKCVVCQPDQIVNSSVQDDIPFMNIYDHTEKNMRRTTEILSNLEFTLKDPLSLAISHLNGRRLQATMLRFIDRSHQMDRPQAYRDDGVITTAPKASLFNFLKSFKGNEEAFAGLENRRD
jgi:hypothetical protein